MKRKSSFTSMAIAVFFVTLTLFTSCKKDKTVAVESIALNKTTTSIAMGATELLTVITTPSDASNTNVTWRSSNTAIATIANGIITPVAVGTATITAISQADTLKTSSCTVTITPASGTVYTISGEITSDTKWYAAAKYLLSGYVYVRSGATLTIEPGTIIKGVSGTKAALTINMGGKIMAQGTSTNPIVFTSDKPAGQRSYGDWGGIVICGKAKTNKHDAGAGVANVEGGIDAKAGGNDDNDNSGVFQYVRIEFPGIALASTANSEINGLSLYAVGKGTTIDHVQVSYSGDDSFEFFGGTVNCKYLVAIRGWDDDFDTDNGYTGKGQFFVSLRDPEKADQSGSNGFESDNDADGSTLDPHTAPIWTNISVFGPLVTSTTTINALFKNAMQLRRGSRLSVYNSVFAGFPVGLFLDGALGDTPAQAQSNVLQIEHCVMAGMTANYKTVAAPGSDPISVDTWYLDASRVNKVLATNTELMINDPFNLTAPNFIPKTGSPLLGTAAFTNTKLTDSFFTPVTYIGAFGTENWTTGWCNFDPQNTVY